MWTIFLCSVILNSSFFLWSSCPAFCSACLCDLPHLWQWNFHIFWWGRSQNQSGWKQRLLWLVFGSYLARGSSWAGREQEMWLVAHVWVLGKTHFAPLLPSSIIPINLICVISSHSLNKLHQIPVGNSSNFFAPFCWELLVSVCQLNPEFCCSFSSLSFMASHQLCFQDAVWSGWCFFNGCFASAPKGNLLSCPHHCFLCSSTL